MSVRIELDKRHSVYTCLDNVSGKVVLNLPTEETVSSITVKMEGVARTRLEPPRPFDDAPGRPREKRRAEVEIHRVLYIVQTVFPNTPALAVATNTSGYTLRAGQYEYPFNIRIPINASCTSGAGVGGGLLQKLSIENGTVEYARDATRHVKGTLPPSLSGIPDDAAWVRYFLKVTVNRSGIFKTNLRQHDPFVFLPIEPPRPPPSQRESFGRKKHEFFTAPVVQKRTGIFSPFRRPPPSIDCTPCQFSVEVRLPEPAIVVPNDPLPLRILVTKLEPFKDVIIQRSLQITLISHTIVTAHELSKDIGDSIVLLSVADLYIPILDASSPTGQFLELDASMWRSRSLPDTVPPTFETCNITRKYMLQVDIGLSRGLQQPHIDVLSLILPLHVYSGIRPPERLLATASVPPALPPRLPSSPSLLAPGQNSSGKMGVYSAKTSPVGSPITPSSPQLPRPHSSYNSPTMGAPARPQSIEPDLPPPTYEDAMAEDIAPVDGPRRNYQQAGTYFQDMPDNIQDMR